MSYFSGNIFFLILGIYMNTGGGGGGGVCKGGPTGPRPKSTCDVSSILQWRRDAPFEMVCSLFVPFHTESP